MQRTNVPSRPRAISHLWPRVAVLALVGIAAAGCSNSARFDSNPFASNRQAVQPQDTTGSIGQRPTEFEPRLRAAAAGAEPAGDGRRRRRHRLWRAGSRRLSAGRRRHHRIGARASRAAAGARRALDLGRRSAGDRQPRRNGGDDRAQIRRAGFRHSARPTASATAPRCGRASAWSFRVTFRRAPARPRAANPGAAGSTGAQRGKRSHRRAGREPDRHRAQARHLAHRLGARQ